VDAEQQSPALSILEGAFALVVSAKSGKSPKGLAGGLVNAMAKGSKPASIGFSTTFNAANPRAVAWALNRSATLVQGISQSAREAIREAVARGIEEGLPAASTASAIRDVIGLTERMVDAVMNLRGQMIEDGATADEIESRTTEYADELLQARAEMIAATETMAAVNAGQNELWNQAVENGELPSEGLAKIWIASDDACQYCLDRNGEQCPIGEEFDGGDPPEGAHPHCRCTMGLAEDTIAYDTTETPVAASERMAFNPNHDAKGEFTSGGGTWSSGDSIVKEGHFLIPSDRNIYFHGTVESARDSIREKGLVPAGGKGGDAWAAEQEGIREYAVGDRIGSVFMARDSLSAIEYANFASQMNPGSRGLILAVKVPAGTKLKNDEHEAAGVRYKGTIPPSWIRVVDRWTGEMEALAAGEDADFYLVLMCDENPDRLAYNKNHDAKGQFSEGSDGKVRKGDKDKIARALATYKPSTRAKQRKAEANEGKLADAIRGKKTRENSPLDVLVKIGGRLHGIEVKTMLDNKNDKITMHPDSRRRKEAWAEANDAILHTVIYDNRRGRNDIYYHEGVGAFRLATMTRISGYADLRRMMKQ
jgi:hypothetical protein